MCFIGCNWYISASNVTIVQNNLLQSQGNVSSIHFTDTNIVATGSFVWYQSGTTNIETSCSDFQALNTYLELNNSSAVTLMATATPSTGTLDGNFIFKGINTVNQSGPSKLMSINFTSSSSSYLWTFEDISGNWTIGTTNFPNNVAYASCYVQCTIKRVEGITYTAGSYSGISASQTAGTSPFTFPWLPYNTIYVLKTIAGMTALTLDGQALFGGVFAVGQTFFVGAMHTLIATWAATAPVFEILTVE
jgi:hypothetical protein